MKLHIFRNKKAKTDKPSAVIVYFFGGGWANGTPLQFYRECDYYSSKGMTAITVDYRIRSIDGTSPFESIEDAKDAMRWIRSHASELNIDPERIAAGGCAGYSERRQGGWRRFVQAKPDASVLSGCGQRT